MFFYATNNPNILKEKIDGFDPLKTSGQKNRKVCLYVDMNLKYTLNILQFYLSFIPQ